MSKKYWLVFSKGHIQQVLYLLSSDPSILCSEWAGVKGTEFKWKSESKNLFQLLELELINGSNLLRGYYQF